MNSKTIDLSPDRWSRVDELFDEASKLDAAEYAAFLDEACADDVELRDYVLALLRADPTSEDSIEKTIVNTMSLVFGENASHADELRGELIGPYRIERLLGSGGMGMVYLAQRADEHFDQQVAIKLGRHRLVDPEVQLRLKNERQILANLDHPNIARLFDGGTTKDGVPYLVMEYIDGVRIDTYCDRKRLDIVSRLKLFQTICAAVHHAHENLIIHRDIKPQNILVTNDGTLKLLDFGIAKLTDTHGTATDGFTREGAVIMTPASAAPEQLLGNAVTTATDTYALGTLLYLLMTGVRAYPTDGMSPSEAARAICASNVTRPSLRLEQERRASCEGVELGGQHAIERIASDRATSPERLRRQLSGDIDTIILNALRKEPERRYRSASALADDVGLHLRSMPIVARADSWRYRTGKFMRRHYAAVSASVLVVAMLIIFAVVLSVQNRSIVKQRDTAREVSQFLEDIFKAQDPVEARGTVITADAILLAGASRIRADLGKRPEIQAALMGTIGRVYYNLGEYEPSLEMLEQALQLRKLADGENHPTVAAAEHDLARTLIRLAEYQRAEMLLQSALAINRREYGSVSPKVARTLLNLAEVHLQKSELDEAEAFANSSIDIYAQLDDRRGIELANAKNMLARILQVRGDLDRTEALLLEAIEIVTRSEGLNHPYIPHYLQNLGVLQLSKGDLNAAEETLARAVEATRRILGEKHHLLAGTLVYQGTLLHLKGDYVSAELVMRDALSLDIETRGADHPTVGFDMTVLGMLLHDKSDLAAAEDVLRGALEIYAKVLDDDHQLTASALTELGAVLNTTGRLAEAQTVLKRALEIRSKASDPELVAATRVEYADTLSRLGRFDEAEPLLIGSLAVLGDKPGRRQRRASEALMRLYDLSGRNAAE